MTAIRKHLRDAIAILALFVVAVLVGGYILNEQRLRFPFVEPAPFELRAEFQNAQAVTPGQGQTVQVAGVQIGSIARVELEDGRAIVDLDIEPEFDDLIRTDAKALLRPRTGLKDMFVEIDPGSAGAKVAEEGFKIPVQSTLTDVDLDEILAMLDQDTRDYVKLLVNGASEGLEGRGGDLAEVFRRFRPTTRDLARVNRAVGRERRALRRLVSNLAELNAELAGKDEDLSELVTTSAATFGAFASEDRELSRTVRELPPTLRQATQTLGTVRRFADELGPTAQNLIPAFRALERANREVRPFAREAAPIVRGEIRPFARAARPLVRDLAPAAQGLGESAPDLTRSFVVLNHLFNMLGFNVDGREGPDDADRSEGYLYWLAWTTHNTVNLLNTDDANGVMRPIFLTGTCTTLQSLVHDDPRLEFALGLTPILETLCGSPSTASIDVKGAKARLKAEEG